MTPTKTKSPREQKANPAEERRRSQRVMIRVPVTLHVTIANQVVAIRAVTVSVNDHGAMLLCSRTLATDTKLELQQDRTNQRLAGRVTRVPRDSPEGYLIPVEFDMPTPGFWHISFPPTDWKPLED